MPQQEVSGGGECEDRFARGRGRGELVRMTAQEPAGYWRRSFPEGILPF